MQTKHLETFELSTIFSSYKHQTGPVIVRANYSLRLSAIAHYSSAGRRLLTVRSNCSFFRFFDKDFEEVVIEYPICSENFLRVCKVSFANWVMNGVTADGYFITFFW